VSDLSPGEVRRWDASAIDQVFRVVKNRDGTYKDFGDTLGSVQQQLSDWGGEAGDAFHQEMNHKRQGIDAQGRISPGIVAAVEQAEADANACRAEMSDIDQEAARHRWYVPDKAWMVDYESNPNDPDGDLPKLEQRLDALHTKANAADHELATAMRAAVGDVQLDSHGHDPAAAPPASQPTPSGNTTPADQLPLPTKGGQTPFPTEKSKDNGPDVSHHLSDNPRPAPLLAGLSADEWKQRLAHYSPGDPLPDPRTPTGDKAIDALANAAGQQNTTYAWGGNKSKDGPSQGQGDNGSGANQNHDWDRVGFDCGGLVRYSLEQGAGFDVGQGTDAIDSNSHFTHYQGMGGIPSGVVDSKAQAGDVLVFGGTGAYAGSGTDHTGIYIGNGYMINAPESGEPVRVDKVGSGRGNTDILRMPTP
jgi:cell wall-associated NlpC family hydrolase/uncharacterized protein YukE